MKVFKAFQNSSNTGLKEDMPNILDNIKFKLIFLNIRGVREGRVCKIPGSNPGPHKCQ